MRAVETRLKALEAATEAAHPTPPVRPAHCPEETWASLPPHLQQIAAQLPPPEVWHATLPPHLRALLDEHGRYIGPAAKGSTHAPGHH